MARESNIVGTKQVTVSTTEHIHAYLKELTQQGLYGRNVAETASILIAERVRELRKEGEVGREPQMEPED